MSFVRYLNRNLLSYDAFVRTSFLSTRRSINLNYKLVRKGGGENLLERNCGKVTGRPFRGIGCFTRAHTEGKKFRGTFSELCRNNSTGSMFLSVFPRRRVDSRLAFFPPRDDVRADLARILISRYGTVKYRVARER